VTEKTIMENRLRRMAQRRGMKLVKSRRRDVRALDYGTYMLIDINTNAVVAADLANLETVEAWLD
jgi:hypothetical protein